METKIVSFRLMLLVLATILVASIFLWELVAPFSALAELGYLVPMIYIIRFPLEHKNGVALITFTTLLITLGFALDYGQIEPSTRLNVGLTHAFGIAILWLAVGCNYRFGKTLRNEMRSKDQLHAIFNHAMEGILIVNQHGKIILINEFAEKLLGYQNQELVGHNVEILIPKRLRSGHAKKLMEFMARPRREIFGTGRTLMAARKDGSQLPVEIALSYFRNNEGLFAIAFIVDLSEKFRVQEKIRQERKLADTYFDMAPAVFLVMDMTGKVLAINNYACQLLGYAKTDIIGKNWFDNFLPEGARLKSRIHFDDIRLDLPENAGECPLITASGKEIEMRWEYVASKTGEETIVLYSGIDISAQKEHERMLVTHHQAIVNLNEELEQKVYHRTKELQDTVKKLESANEELDRNRSMLTTAIHHFPEGVIGVLNKKLRYVFADGQELHALGLHEQGKNERIFDDVHPALTITAEEKLKPVFDGHRLVYDTEIDGKAYNINAVPIFTPDGLINEIMVVIRNITERKKLEEKLHQTIEKERELASMKSKFVTMASHEFRTPLATIASSAFLLENYSGEDYERKKSRHLDKIKQSVNNMTELLNDFILLGKLEEGKVKVNPTPTNLHQLQEMLELELEAVRKPQQTIHWEVVGENAWANLDKQLLRSILINLIGNALKYSPADADVKVIVTCTDKEVNFKIIDQGIGIPQEEQPHIFKRFFRAQNSNHIGGTGLGLNIARKHVKLMNGRIEFKSKLNEGSTFTVILPLIDKHILKINT